ncbi:hypothetical protein [Desulfatibacillum aliphaticivorans]|nr:hypothetical protein [Desulfatibacillum aliphaticivorans]
MTQCNLIIIVWQGFGGTFTILISTFFLAKLQACQGDRLMSPEIYSSLECSFSTKVVIPARAVRFSGPSRKPGPSVILDLPLK